MDRKYLAYSILEFLEKEKNENLKVAMQIISEKYDVSLQNAEYKLPASLEEIFKEGCKSKEFSLDDPFSFEGDEEYQSFINLLKEKNYFENYKPEDQIYQVRLHQANVGFLKKRQAKKDKADQLKEEGNALVKEKKYEEAIEKYEQAIETDPNNAIFYSNMAAAYTALKRFEDAVETCDRAIRVNPKYAKAYQRKGIAYVYLKKYDEAIDQFEMAKEVDPSNADEYDRKILQARKSKKEMAGSNAGGMPNLFGGGGGGGMPNLFGGNGGGGMPDLSNLGSMMSDPKFMEMAENVMKQPGFQDMVGKMMGQMAGGAGNGENNPFSIPEDAEIPPQAIEELEKLPEVQKSEKLQKVVKGLKEEGMPAILREMGDPEVKELFSKLAQQAFKNMFPEGLNGKKLGNGGNNPFI